MKAVIRLLVRFVFWFALIMLGSSALAVAQAYVIGFDPSSASLAPPAVERFLHALSLFWLPSALVAAMIALFSAARALRAPAIALIVVALAWTGTIIGGAFLFGALEPTSPAPAAIVPQRRLVRSQSYRLYPLARTERDVGPLVLYDEGRDPGFRTVARATIDLEEARLELPEGTIETGPVEDTSIDLTALANSYPAMVRPPALIAPLAADVTATSDLLALDGQPLVAGMLNLVALSLYLAGCWTLVRLTRWPVFNLAFVLGALRLAFWLVPAVRTGVLRDLLVAGFDSRALPYASAILLGGLGLGLLAILVFLPPMEQWRREVTDG